MMWLTCLVVQSILLLPILYYLRKEKTPLVDLNQLLMKALIKERNVLHRKLAHAKYEQEKIHKNRLAFLASSPHELRTPLHAILGLSELLQRPKVNDLRRLEFSRLIYLRGYDLLYAINNQIELSKITSGKLLLIRSKVDVRHLFDEISKEYHSIYSACTETKNVIFLQEVVITHDNLSADIVRLRHVLNSLLRNAIQFTKAGTILLGCKHHTNDSKVLFYLSDTGQGIPREYLDLIFLPFEKVPESISGVSGGAGLGLAICKEIVGCWGGEIWVDSIVGTGSVFYFTLPLLKNTGLC